MHNTVHFKIQVCQEQYSYEKDTRKTGSRSNKEQGLSRLRYTRLGKRQAQSAVSDKHTSVPKYSGGLALIIPSRDYDSGPVGELPVHTGKPLLVLFAKMQKDVRRHVQTIIGITFSRQHHCAC